jgi:hypothetical protein
MHVSMNLTDRNPTKPANNKQLFNRYRRKAALFSGKALVELKEYGAALPVLEAAKQVGLLLCGCWGLFGMGMDRFRYMRLIDWQGMWDCDTQRT